MRILITGAGGLVGSHLAGAFPGASAFRHHQLDITDAQAVHRTVDRVRPDVVFNCAVIGVDQCESDPALAARINVDGPAHLAEAAERAGAMIVHFSSNYVFDGRRTDGLPYTIEDDPEPVNVYGQTKLRGERAVAAAASRAIVIRTSWVFGRGKESFLGTVVARLRNGERIVAVADIFASTTYVADLIERVGEIVQRGEPGTYHVVNDGVCSHEQFAREAARLTGAPQPLIEPVPESSSGRSATRPRRTPMRCLLSERLGLAPLRPWQQALLQWSRA